MGFNQMHVCAHCWYEVMISGGKDCGFAAFTETFECRICRSLGDYEVALTPGGEAMGFSAVEKPKCEDCNNEDLVPWDLEAQGHCPRCGHKMRVDQSLGSINWD